jgi:AraC-like DNA-binding protein
VIQTLWIMSVFNFFKNFLSKYRNSDPDYKTVFDHYFFDSKYYLNPTASIEDFSSLLNVSPAHLNHISKVNYNCLFETLLNEHRYVYFLDELNNPINSNLSMDSIIKLCGYDDKDKFLEVVKKNANKS